MSQVAAVQTNVQDAGSTSICCRLTGVCTDMHTVQMCGRYTIYVVLAYSVAKCLFILVIFSGIPISTQWRNALKPPYINGCRCLGWACRCCAIVVLASIAAACYTSTLHAITKWAWVEVGLGVD